MYSDDTKLKAKNEQQYDTNKNNIQRGYRNEIREWKMYPTQNEKWKKDK